MTTRTRTAHDVYDMTEGEILVRGTLDPTEALKHAIDGNSYRTDHYLHAFSEKTPEAGRVLGDTLLSMLSTAKPGLYRKNPVGRGTAGDDQGWKWQLGFASAKGPGTFEGVLFP